MDIYKCGKCGTMVDEIKHVGCHPSCCGQPMTLLVPGTSDEAVEKHLPVASVEGNKVSVVVGSVEHPMLEEHFIEWIAIETSNGMQRRFLKAGDAPKAEFLLADGEECVAVYAYCNLHGLWKA